uniref:aspartate carbamoyltransferase n=1 Tax=Albugo laibachii Nc14 TaxID=890382 RepID=F0WT97_9STRA|nr:unnamed protein product [Albugo laibachii Nc14]|eukprot:CCA24586.1 unnamed protein product [Albugo laibachii Nc14]
MVTQEPWAISKILSIKDFDIASILRILKVADEMKEIVTKQGSCQLLKGKILANVFYEPSTRTNCSFQAAMLRLGGAVIPVNESTSSAQKGEILGDTIRCLECYADVIVLRHPERGSAAVAAAATSKPLINAGDGIGEHPTQALLDLFTIYNELGTTDLAGKIVTMVGDLKNGRTVHSLAKLLALFKVKIYYISPDTLKMPREIIQSLNDSGIEQHESNDLEPVMNITDVLYVTRVQKERFASAQEYEAVKNNFKITLLTIQNAKSSLIIMHPLPRVGEIAEEVDQDPRAAYFGQMKNGMYVRMALLALVLGVA